MTSQQPAYYRLYDGVSTLYVANKGLTKVNFSHGVAESVDSLRLLMGELCSDFTERKENMVYKVTDELCSQCRDESCSRRKAEFVPDGERLLNALGIPVPSRNNGKGNEGDKRYVSTAMVMLDAMAPYTLESVTVDGWVSFEAYSARSQYRVGLHDLKTATIGPDFHNAFIAGKPAVGGDVQQGSVVRHTVVRSGATVATLEFHPSLTVDYCWLCKKDHIRSGELISRIGAGWAGMVCIDEHMARLNIGGQANAVILTAAFMQSRVAYRDKLRVMVCEVVDRETLEEYIPAGTNTRAASEVARALRATPGIQDDILSKEVLLDFAHIEHMIGEWVGNVDELARRGGRDWYDAIRGIAQAAADD